MSVTPVPVDKRWVLRRPDGRTLETDRLPATVSCGVCGEAVELSGATGRIVCTHCGAHVLSLLDRSLAVP